jgi:hypothetical protein
MLLVTCVERKLDVQGEAPPHERLEDQLHAELNLA